MHIPPHSRLVFGKRKSSSLLLALAVILFAAVSARATIIINASEAGGNVAFTLSGSFNTSSATFLQFAAVTPGNQVTPSAGFIAFSGGSGLNQWILPNFSGPGSFGSGGSISNFTGSANNAFAGFFLVGPGQTGMALLSSYVSGSALTGSLTLTGQSFASLGIAPGTYVSSWNNGGISDGLTMTINPSQSVPETGSVLCMLGLSVAGMIVAARRWAVAATVHST
jgi:hypothetical protein